MTPQASRVLPGSCRVARRARVVGAVRPAPGARPAPRALMFRRPWRSEHPDVLRLVALATRHDLELDALALFQRTEPSALYGGEVDEDVLPGIGRDEPVPLLVVE